MTGTASCTGFHATWLARSARNAALPTSSSDVDKRALRGRLDDRFERGEHALAVALPERDEAHAGRNQIGGDRVQKGVQRRLKRDAVARSRDADRDRVGHWPSPGRGQPVERRRKARPPGSPR